MIEFFDMVVQVTKGKDYSYIHESGDRPAPEMASILLEGSNMLTPDNLKVLLLIN